MLVETEMQLSSALGSLVTRLVRDKAVRAATVRCAVSDIHLQPTVRVRFRPGAPAARPPAAAPYPRDCTHNG